MWETVPRARTEPATLSISPPSPAPEPDVVAKRSFVIPTRVASTGSEASYAAGAPQPVSPQETVVKSEGPRVHIGVVEIVVAAAADKRAPAPALAPSSNLASCRYLRSL